MKTQIVLIHISLDNFEQLLPLQGGGPPPRLPRLETRLPVDKVVLPDEQIRNGGVFGAGRPLLLLGFPRLAFVMLLLLALLLVLLAPRDSAAVVRLFRVLLRLLVMTAVSALFRFLLLLLANRDVDVVFRGRDLFFFFVSVFLVVNYGGADVLPLVRGHC